jgi:Signal transduction histidine kinase
MFLNKFAISSNVSTYLSRTIILITVITTIVIASILIFQQQLYFERLSKKISDDYIQNQKIYIKEIVNNEIEYIQIQNEYFKNEISEKIKHNVNQAYFIAENIYDKFSGKKSPEEIKELIIATISSLKFDLEYEEVFISTLDGIGVFYPRKPDFAGKNMVQFKDANGLPVVQKEINLLKNKEEGFLDYSIESAPDDKASQNKKIAYVKKFGHFNWYFGSKQYLNDYFPKFRDEIAKKISSIRFKHGGYVFMNNKNGVPIVMDGAIYKGALNMLSDLNDVRHPIFLQQLEAVERAQDGDFFYYKWNKIKESKPIEKCSFVKPFPEYNWIIGAGFYLDEIDQTIAEQQKNLHNDQRKNIVIILIILLILLFLETLIIYHFNFRYKSDFKRFFNFFFSLQTSFKQLNTSDLFFDEFKQAANEANKMVHSRKEIEEKLVEEQKRATESDRLKSAFLANMSHEIRTPMNAIVGFSELLLDESHVDEDKRLFIKLIQKNGEILLNLINDIIDISKIEANLLTIRKKNIHLNKFLNEIDYHYTETLSTKTDKNLKFNVVSGIVENTILSSDEVRLRQVLDNLIGNAIKFTNKGSVTLEVYEKDSFIHFMVIDTGIGIPQDEQATIFGRFMQVEHSHNVNYGGTGLGLAISKNLIDLLGGNLQVKSEVGKGSTFFFKLPVC